MEMSYFQLKEFKASLKRGLATHQQLNQEFVNEYGDSAEICEALVLGGNGEVLKFIRNRKELGVGHLIPKMVSEIVVLLSMHKQLIPKMIREGMLEFMLGLKDKIEKQSYSKSVVVNQAFINIGQVSIYLLVILV